MVKTNKPRKKNEKNIKNIKKSLPPRNDDDDDESVDSRDKSIDIDTDTDTDYEYDSDDSEISSPRPMKKKPRKSLLESNKKKLKKRIPQNNEDDDEDEDEEKEEEEEEESEEDQTFNIIIPFGGGVSRKFIPKRYDLNKEPVEVKKFVDLLSKSNEPSTIDNQIDQFKELNKETQNKMLIALEHKSNHYEESIMFKILKMNISPQIQSFFLEEFG